MQQAFTRIRAPSLRSAAQERWDVCSAAAATSGGEGRRSTLVSFDWGRSPRPLTVYLQNLLCPLLNVTVRYPFAHEKFQRAMWSTNVHSR